MKKQTLNYFLFFKYLFLYKKKRGAKTRYIFTTFTLIKYDFNEITINIVINIIYFITIKLLYTITFIIISFCFQ